MQVVILAGGFGTRLSEETDLIPKPMVRIGGIPIIHHIMNIYSSFGHKEFLVALGYKGEVLVDYFGSNQARGLQVDLVDTGLNTSTGGRIKALESMLQDEFMMTYGDGLSDINIGSLIHHHRKFARIATVTAVRPPARFGTLNIVDNLVTKFAEKDPQNEGWINGGFFCLNKKVCSYIKDLSTSFESEPMRSLVEAQQLTAFQHEGWWQPMDTLRDKRELQTLWDSGSAPWLIS
jgi:glucose-1-phosphate cytidylyltransferase